MLTTPTLLIAGPNMLDPNFSKTVILLAEHNNDGSIGFILNRCSTMRISDVMQNPKLTEQSDAIEGEFDPLIWHAGPCHSENGVILCPEDNMENFNEIQPIAPGIVLSNSQKLLEYFLQNPSKISNHVFRVLVGYAGWGPQQLGHEIREGTWLNMDIDHELVFNTPYKKMWNTAMEKIGITDIVRVRMERHLYLN